MLDTHVLLWLAEDHPNLGRRASRLADAALHRDELHVSAISFWEIAMLVERRRLRIEMTPSAMRRTSLEQGIREVPISGAIGIVAAELTGLHADPADRMIVATALSLDAALITADASILRSRLPLEKHDARR